MLTDTHRILIMVAEFNGAFNHRPTIELAADLLEEEAGELVEALSNLQDSQTVENMAHALKEAADYLYVSMGMVIVTDREGVEPPERAIAIVSTINTVMQNPNRFMTDDLIIETVRRVHASNMSKLDDEGRPIRNEAGKVLKGPKYQVPDLSDLAQQALDNLATLQAEYREAAEAA